MIGRRRRRFANRADAGRRLAASLHGYRASDPLILGLPRGGVTVAAPIAELLDADLDALGVAKVGVPRHEELAMGAVGEHGVVAINEDVVARSGVSRSTLAAAIEKARRQVANAMGSIRATVPAIPIEGRLVIIVDDGLATGATARAGVDAARAAGADRVVVAVPVGADDTVTDLRAFADDVVCLESHADFIAVGVWYDDFSQTRSDDVIAALTEARRNRSTDS